MLAVTGVCLCVMTATGALLRHFYPTALWSQVALAVSLGGLVGFATNWLAIKMLFHPRVRMLGVQGVVPRRRKELARSVGQTLEAHLISGARMHRLLVDSGALTAALDRVSSHLPRLLEDEQANELLVREAARTIHESAASFLEGARGRLREMAAGNLMAMAGGTGAGMTVARVAGPVAGGVAGVLVAGLVKSGMLDGLVDRVIDGMAEQMRDDATVDDVAREVVAALPAQAERLLAQEGIRQRLGKVLEAMAEELVGRVDVARLVEVELLARDEGELEEIIDRVAANELGFVQVAGGGLGMIAGLALVWPWLLAPLAAGFLLLVWLARRAERRVYTSRETSLQTPESTAQNTRA
jgi:uncharacterized membrane-anchored protein YjiN (DUF445 family)